MLRRLAWHVRAAWRASRVAVPVAAAGGVLLRLVLPVQDAWLAAAVAATAALLAVVVLALGEARRAPLPRAADPDAAVEQMAAPDLVGLVLARASMVLGAFALGLALGGALGLQPAAGGEA